MQGRSGTHLHFGLFGSWELLLLAKISEGWKNAHVRLGCGRRHSSGSLSLPALWITT